MNKIEFRESIVGGGNKQFSSTESFDDYFNLSGRKFRVITALNGSTTDYLVSAVKTRVNIPLAILKVISYFTGILPLIMLIGKAIARSRYHFHLMNAASLKNVVLLQNNIRTSLARQVLLNQGTLEQKVKTNENDELKECFEKFIDAQDQSLQKIEQNIKNRNLMLEGNVLKQLGGMYKEICQCKKIIADEHNQTVRETISRFIDHMQSQAHEEYIRSAITLSVESPLYEMIAEHIAALPKQLHHLKKSLKGLNCHDESLWISKLIKSQAAIIQSSFENLGKKGDKHAHLTKWQVKKMGIEDNLKELLALKAEIKASLLNEGCDTAKITTALFSTQDLIDQAQLQQAICKVHIASTEGVTFHSDKGATGTLMLRDKGKKGEKQGKLIGVFKPGIPELSVRTMFTAAENYVKKLGGQLSLLKKEDPLAQPKGEVLAYLIDRHFHFMVVPPSKITTLQEYDPKTLKPQKKTEGALQVAAASFKKGRDGLTERTALIAERLQEAKDAAALDKEHFSEEELNKFQRFAVHDFLIGNLDAHSENWFVEENNGRIKDIIGIDKANCFIVENPSDKTRDIPRHNQYLWGDLTIAKQPFTKEMRQLMASIHKESIEAFLNSLDAHKHLAGFVDERMKEKLLQRAAAINVTSSTENATPETLTHYIIDKDFSSLSTPIR